MKIKNKTTKQKLLWLRDLSRDSWPMLIFMLMYILVFTLLEKATRLHYTVIHSPLDDRIPFIEYFVVPYFMWFGYIAFNMISLYLKDRRTYLSISVFLMIGMTVMLVVSFVFPNIQYLRPQVMPRNNLFTRMVAHLYKTDTPTNICPSIHVYNTVAVMLGLWRTDSSMHRKAFRIPMNIIGVLIILSTMFIKQHSVLDVAAAFGLSYASYLAVFRYHAGSILLRGNAGKQEPLQGE